MLKTLSRSVLSLIYPQECDICHREVESPDDGNACSTCWVDTRIFNGNETLCKKCGAFLFGAPSLGRELQCEKCVDHHYDRALAVGLYERALSVTVVRLKRQPYIPSRLKRLVVGALDRLSTDERMLVVPVPLSTRRYRERGFNQADILARLVAVRADLSLDIQSLVRDVDTPMHRAGMDRKARAMTVKRSFRVARPKLIEGRSILLIDDVLTSGATASVCADVLKKSGASTVNVLTIARAA